MLRKLYGCLLSLTFLFPLGCSSTLKNFSPDDMNKLKTLAGIAKEFGGRGRMSLRAGRPFMAGVIEGIIVVPGVEIDVEASGDASRSTPPSDFLTTPDPVNEPRLPPTRPAVSISAAGLDSVILTDGGFYKIVDSKTRKTRWVSPSAWIQTKD